MMRLCVVLLPCFLLLVDALGPNVIQTDSGPVIGHYDEDVEVWRGIPFGAPPVGPSRLTVPRKPAPWTKTRDCLLQAPICPQVRITDHIFLGEEDCLYLDVYAPKDRTPDIPLPVLVWFYGGGFVFGDGYEFGFYDGKNLARKRGYIFVTVNYRLGPLGFLALDGLRAEANTTGNYGVQDQRFALQWVQDNIKAFGGDPDQVTIAGESAGAFSVCYHVASPASAGLFHAAILESGTCDAPQFFVPYNISRDWSNDYMTGVGCSPQSANFLECTRNLPTGVIMGSLLDHADTYWSQLSTKPPLWPIMPWAPTIDGAPQGLLDVPINRIKAGTFNKVPTIMGTNEDEGSIFVLACPLVVPGTTLPMNNASLNAALLHFFNNNQTIVDRALDLYPPPVYKTVDKRTAAILRDFFFACPARRTLRALSKQSVPAYLYHFTYVGDWIEDPILGDYHSAELEYVMDNAWPPIVHIFSDRDTTIAEAFGSYWGNMVWNTDPNKGPFTPPVDWPVFTAGSEQNVIIDIPVAVQADLFETVCPFWDWVKEQLYPGPTPPPL